MREERAMQTRGQDSHAGADGRDVAASPAPPRMPATPEAGQARRDPPPEPSESSALRHLISDFQPPDLGDRPHLLLCAVQSVLLRLSSLGNGCTCRALCRKCLPTSLRGGCSSVTSPPVSTVCNFSPEALRSSVLEFSTC